MGKNSPNMQPWTMRYQRTIQLLCRMMGDIDNAHRILWEDRRGRMYLDELQELGIIEEIRPGYFLINKENLRKYSVVVSDELYNNMTDLDWAKEQRKKLNYIKGKVKGPEFRARQEARRKKRREYAKQQKAKFLAQPPEELSLSEIIFDNSLSLNKVPESGEEGKTDND